MYKTKNLIKCVLICAWIFQGCLSNTQKKVKINPLSTHPFTPGKNKSNADFSLFIKKFKLLSLPLTIRTEEIVVDSSAKLTAKDNAFIKCEYPDEIYAYGMLPDTTDCYKIIWLEPTEIEVPVLTTFTKDGKKIKQDELGVGQCGSDCGYSCSEFINIDKNQTIFSGDSVETTDCDTNGNLKPNTTQKYILYKTARIHENGDFKMSAILKKPIN